MTPNEGVDAERAIAPSSFVSSPSSSRPSCSGLARLWRAGVVGLLCACHRVPPASAANANTRAAGDRRAAVPPGPVAPLHSPPATDTGPIRVAVTVDDLPSHGPLPPDTTRLQLHQSLLTALLAHEVPRVYGFANLGRAAQDGATDPSLRAWIAAGFPLGNHTWSHPHLREIGVPAYLAEIDRNDAALGSLVADENTRRVFRYPFLVQGTDPQSTRAIRRHLSGGGYRIAEVTIDFYDWAFNAPYVRCLALRDEAAIAALRETFVRHAVRMLAVVR